MRLINHSNTRSEVEISEGLGGGSRQGRFKYCPNSLQNFLHGLYVNWIRNGSTNIRNDEGAVKGKCKERKNLFFYIIVIYGDFLL